MKEINKYTVCICPLPDNAYKKEGLSSSEIARRIDRSPFVVNNCLKLGNTYAIKKYSGRPRKLTPRQDRKVIRQLSTGRTSLGKLTQEPNIQEHKSTLSRMEARSKVLSYKKKKREPRLTMVHKKSRVSWAKEHVIWKNQWK